MSKLYRFAAYLSHLIQQCATGWFKLWGVLANSGQAYANVWWYFIERHL